MAFEAIVSDQVHHPGEWLSKPFRSSQKAIHKSGSAGRRGRGKMPL